MKYNFTKILIVVLSALLIAPRFAVASVIEFSPSSGNFRSDSQVPVTVLINTGQEKINAVSAEIVVPSNVQVEVSDGNSIISNFITGPSITGNKVKFSGIIPGGYSGHDGILVILLITGPTGLAPLNFVVLPQVLLHDGEGTADTVAVVAAELEFSPNGQTISPIEDTTPPEAFTVEITKNPTLHDGQYVALFATQDKGSGIDHYEVLEGKSYNDGEWKKASSPYVLQDQSRGSYVYVKAIDRAGNEQVAYVVPAYEGSFAQKALPVFLILISILILFTVWRVLTHHRMIKQK